MKKFYFLIFFIGLTTVSFSQTKDKVPKQETIKAKEIVGFKMYPNPVINGILFINTLENSQKDIQIFDVLGKQVFSKSIINQRLDISKLTSGIYILKVSEKGKVATRKLVIK